MNLSFDKTLAKGYTSASQIVRVLSENWVAQEGYCPNCGTQPLSTFANNAPVADFYCGNCSEQFELKSKKAKLSLIINDGAYASMIERISGEDNPNFFFLTYSKGFCVNNFLIIPKHFFTADIIIKRPPLPPTARRAGWVGCNIDLRHVPASGKVFLVHNQSPVAPKEVVQKFQQTTFLRRQNLHARGWTLDVMRCVDKLPEEFTLGQVYEFANLLQAKHPDNQHIHAKIRQQLQILRDKGLIEFLGRGKYRKLG